jgi:hypothetical protein
MKKRVTRVAIVCDEDCNWYVRRIREVGYDFSRDERVYYCDLPIGSRFDTLDGACNAAMAAWEPRRPPTSFVGAFGGKADLS